jgi:hypothetical protein
VTCSTDQLVPSKVCPAPEPQLPMVIRGTVCHVSPGFRFCEPSSGSPSLLQDHPCSSVVDLVVIFCGRLAFQHRAKAVACRLLHSEAGCAALLQKTNGGWSMWSESNLSSATPRKPCNWQPKVRQATFRKIQSSGAPAADGQCIYGSVLTGLPCICPR